MGSHIFGSGLKHEKREKNGPNRLNSPHSSHGVHGALCVYLLSVLCVKVNVQNTFSESKMLVRK